MHVLVFLDICIEKTAVVLVVAPLDPRYAVKLNLNSWLSAPLLYISILTSKFSVQPTCKLHWQCMALMGDLPV
jgi:hypothetical protein